MSEWYDNRSAEVVLRQPRSWSNQRKCLDGCRKRLQPREFKLVLQLFGDQGARNDLALGLGVSGAELKKIRSRLATCIKRCTEEAEEKAFPE